MTDEAVAEVVEEELPESVETEPSEETETASGEDEATESAEAEEAKPSDSSPEKKDDGFQKRIDELTKRYYQEKQQADEYRQQLEAIQRQQTQKPEPGKTLADFEYDEAQFANYQRELAKEEARAETEAMARQQQQKARMLDFQVSESKFAETAEDYFKLTRQDYPVSPAMAEAIIGSEFGPQVNYHLAKHPDIAARIAQMSDFDAAREIGRLEATVSVKKPSISEAPPPTPKIKPKDARTEKSLTDPMSQAEFEKRRRAVIAKR